MPRRESLGWSGPGRADAQPRPTQMDRLERGLALLLGSPPFLSVIYSTELCKKSRILLRNSLTCPMP